MAILDAAGALFAELGYASVSIADIAQSAGVSKANVFHHFRSKEALYFEVMRSASVGHAVFAEQLLAQPGSCAQKVADLVAFEIRWMFENECRTWLLMRESAERGQTRVKRLGRQVFQRNFSAVVRIFEEGQRRGEFRASLDPAAAAMLLFGATNLFFRARDVLQGLREMRELIDPAVYARSISAMILEGLQVQGHVAPVRSRRGGAATAGDRPRRPAVTRTRAPS